MNAITAPNALFTTVSNVCGDDVSLDYFAEAFLDPADAMSAAYWVYLIAVLLPALQKVASRCFEYFEQTKSKCASRAGKVLPRPATEEATDAKDQIQEKVEELKGPLQEKVEEKKEEVLSKFESIDQEIQDAATGSNAESQELDNIQQQLRDGDISSGFQKQLNCFFVLLQLLALLLAAVRYTWKFPSITGVGSNSQCAIVLWAAMPMVKTVR
jgi:gas vesicle protein